MDSRKDGKKSSRRDAIKRLGLIGVGAALVPTAGRGRVPLGSTAYVSTEECNKRCIDEYMSGSYYVSNAYHSSAADDEYFSQNTYVSECYYSCEHVSYSSYTSLIGE